MFSDNPMRLNHILDAAREALEFIQNRQREDLDKDRQLELSLVKLLEIIGEAARGLTDDFKNNHPEIPWKKIVSMRNRLTHGYFDVNLDIVWETVARDLPPLIEVIEKIKEAGFN